MKLLLLPSKSGNAITEYGTDSKAETDRPLHNNTADARTESKREREENCESAAEHMRKRKN